MAKGAIKAVIATQFDATGLNKAQKSIGSFGKSLKGTLAGIGIGLGIGAIANELEAASKAAVADVKAQALLAQQMRNTTGANAQQIASTEAFIQKLQMQTAVLDDKLRPAMASLVRATGDVSKAQELLALSTDVSAATGKDLEAVSLALGKAVSGQTTALFRMIPGLKGSSDWMAKLKQETTGAAEAAANTDPFARLNVIFNDIQEQIGLVLLPTLQDFANWFASPDGQKQVQEFVDVIKAGVLYLADFAKYIAANIKWLGPLAIGITTVSVAMSILNAIMLANPFTLIAASIATVTLGLVALGIAAFDANNQLAKIDTQYFGRGSSNFVNGIQAPDTTDETARLLRRRAESVAATARIDIPAMTKSSGAAKKLTTDTSALTKAVDAAKAAFEAKVKVYQEAIQAAQQLIDSTKEMTAGFVALFKTTPQMGEFESKTVDAFQNIFDTIKSSLADKRILQSAADALTAYTNSTLTSLKAIAKEQDVLAGKIDIARTITSGVTGLANITGMLDSTTESVTSSVRTMANGIETIITKTMDVTKTGGLVDNFQKLVDKTKAFAKNLIDLKKLGLNKNLFAQLVNAGADAGGATAQAIVDGGSETIMALNDLYGQLDMAAADIAQTTTDTLYEVGQQVVTNGFIEGLVSQSDALAAAAESMANAFATAFNAQFATALQAALPSMPVAPATQAIGTRPDPKRSPQSYAAWLAGIGGIDPIRSPQSYAAQQATYNITLQTGIVTSAAGLGAEVVSAISAYERASGSVYVKATA